MNQNQEQLSVSDEFYEAMKGIFEASDNQADLLGPEKARYDIVYIAAEAVETILNHRKKDGDHTLERFQDYLGLLANGRNPFHPAEVRAAGVSLDRWQMILDSMRDKFAPNPADRA